MSAIHAFFRQPSSAGPPVASVMEKLLDGSDYWRPDATHRYCPDADVALGKATLFNLPGAERDAIHSHGAAQVCCTANARLDNRDELLAQLGGGRRSVDPTDGELILQSYLTWGERCVDHLRGDFAFIIWDANLRHVFCARDPIGVKVLFYAPTEAGLLISNEHRSLLHSGLLEPTLKTDWIGRQLIHFGIDRFSSPVDGIEVLPPAHTLVLAEGALSLRRYWQLKPIDLSRYPSESALLAELGARFDRAVQRRLTSAFPVATELSEGLDSSGIAGCAAQLDPDSTLYTISYDGIPTTPETAPVWEQTYRDIEAMLAMHPNLQPVWQSPPFVDSSNSEQRRAYQAAFGAPVSLRGGSHVRVALAADVGARTLLSGWGGDHCATTYGDHYESELFAAGHWIGLHRLLRDKRRRGRGERALKAWLKLIAKHSFPLGFRHGYLYRKGLTGMMRRWLDGAPVADRTRHGRLFQQARAWMQNYDCKSVQARDWRELHSPGLVNRLTDSELSGRCHKVEYRFPMLDVELLEFAYSVPAWLKIKGGVERYMYRQILAGRTPEKTRWRSKADVDLPKWDLEQWTRDRQRRLYAELDPALLGDEVDFAKLEKLIAQPSPLTSHLLTVLTSTQWALQSGQVSRPA